MTFYRADRIIELVRAPDDARREEGDDVTFSVELSESTDDVTWFHNGRRISDDGNYRCGTKGRQHHVTITNLSRDDCGSVRVKANNIRVSFLTSSGNQLVVMT